MSGLSAPNITDLKFASFEDHFSSWTCVHSCLTCVRVRKKCSVGKTLITQPPQLQNHTQRIHKVVVGSRSSPSFYCTKGVPQGSVLSPLLFNIYVSNLHSVAKENNSSLRSFADDMTLYHSDTSAEQASKTVCAALNIINGELVDLGLPINVEKSAALLICPSAKKSNQLPSTPPILLCGTPVNVVTEMRLLGVIVDNHLSWSSQVNSVISKVSRKIGILRRNIHQLSPSARRLFYLAARVHKNFLCTLAGSHSTGPSLEYAATETIPFMSTSLRDRLCSVWRRAVRCVAGADWQAEVAPILKNHRLTSIEHRCKLGTPVCCCRAKMCSKIGSSLSVHKTKFYRTFSSNQGKRKFSSTILSLLSARHALIH